MNLVLIGYRGTGKSVTGEVLADMLDMELFSMDEEIVKEAGMPIPEIVEKHGWDYFRDMETAVADKLSQKNGVIIDAGGGVIEREENIPLLKKNGLIFWLQASVDTIISRISDDTNRPSLTGGKSFIAEVKQVLGRRRPKYQAAADIVIDTDERTAEDVAKIVVGYWTQTED